jgi:hypothetical protein
MEELLPTGSRSFGVKRRSIGVKRERLDWRQKGKAMACLSKEIPRWCLELGLAKKHPWLERLKLL